jgi:hypothetical protein
MSVNMRNNEPCEGTLEQIERKLFTLMISFQRLHTHRSRKKLGRGSHARIMSCRCSGKLLQSSSSKGSTVSLLPEYGCRFKDDFPRTPFSKPACFLDAFTTDKDASDLTRSDEQLP